MYRRKIVEVWEVQRWSWSEGWSAATWCDSQGVALAVAMHELKPPSGWSWDTSKWEMQDETSCQPWCGWEYASTTKRFKRARRWSMTDRARRRRWTRVAIKACRVFRKSSDEKRIKDGLEQVQRTRRALTSKARLAGTQFDSARVRASLEELARAGEDEAREVSRLLEAAPKSTAVKLRRDLYKEVSAMADVLRSLPPPQTAVTRRPQYVVKSGTLSVGPSPPPSNVSVDDDARTDESDSPDDVVDRKLCAVSEAAVIQNLMAERHDAIQDIHVAIHSINSLVKDLAKQVETQQPLVDAIEANTANTKLAVHQANRQVLDAADVDTNQACTIS